MSIEIKNSKIYKILDERKSEFIRAIDAITPIIQSRLDTQIPKLFPEYTLHNMQHSIRVLEYISDIVLDINNFNDFELTLMLLGALLHDIGMALGKPEIDLITSNQLLPDKNINYESFVKVYGERAEQEIIRRYHAEISGMIITQDRFKQHFLLNEPHGISYAKELQLLCESHTKDILWMENSLSKHKIKGKYDYNLRYIAHIIRIADLLDIDQSRTPYELYKLINPKGVSDIEWRQHFIVENTKKIEKNPRTGNRDIVFYGESNEIKAHRKLMSYINWINDEIKVFKEYYEQLDDDKFKCNLSSQVVTNIRTNGFKVSDYLLSLDFQSITELLMGENIYGDRRLGLREIIQNSIDACLVRKEIEKHDPEYKPIVSIQINSNENTFSISDNGIGMSENIIKNYFLNIGKSFYKSDLFKLSDYKYNPIGSFGIGFLACFMLSEDVTILTRYFNDPIKHTIQLEKGDEYIGFNSLEDVNFNGTTIKLILNQVLEVFEGDVENIISFINQFFINDDYELKIFDGKKNIEIQNSIFDENKAEKNETIDDIEKYIKDAKGYIKIRNKHSFIREIADLKETGENIFYISNETNIENEVCFENIVDVENNKLIYLHLPLFYESQKNDFDTAMDILDGDIDSTILKIDSANDAYIFFPYKLQEELIEEDIYEDMNPVIYGEIYLSDILENFNDVYFCPKINLVDINLLENDSFNILIQFSELHRYYYLWSDESYKLYLRNILIKDYNYNKQLIANTIELQGYSLNIFNSEIFPDISRNGLLPDSKSIIDNSLNIAIHLSALENFNLKLDEKNVLLKFIKKKLIGNSHLIHQEILKKYGL